MYTAASKPLNYDLVPLRKKITSDKKNMHGPARTETPDDIKNFMRHRLIKLLGFTPKCLAVPGEKKLKCKFRCWSMIELVQHMILFFFAGYLIASILNNINRGIFDYDKLNKRLILTDFSSGALLFILLLELIVMTIGIYFIRKIVFVIPSLPMLWDKEFIPLLTADLSVWAVFVIIILELSDTLAQIFGETSHST